MSEFKVTFKDRDGNLIQDRKVDALSLEFYIDRHGRVDKEFTEMVLCIDAREKGVKIVSYTINKDTGIDAVVDYF